MKEEAWSHATELHNAGWVPSTIPKYRKRMGDVCSLYQQPSSIQSGCGNFWSDNRMTIQSVYLWEWFFPIRSIEFVIPVPYTVAQPRLAKMLEEDIVTAPPTWLTPNEHYEGRMQGSTFEITGPFGYKRWRVTARGQLIAEYQHTRVRGQMWLSRMQLISVGVMALIYCVGAYSIFGDNLIVFVPWQLLFLYVILLGIFRYTAFILQRGLINILVTGDWCC